MDLLASPCVSGDTRKRIAKPQNWQRNLKKFSRYSPKDLPTRPRCNHNTKAFKCSTLTMEDLKTFHLGFYKFKDKLKQDAILLKYCTAIQIKRRRPTQNPKKNVKEFQTKFTIFSKSQRVPVPVCQNAFLNILNITKHRVQYVMKQHKKTCGPPEERRGGDHKSHLYRPKKEAVMKYINLFHVDEAHYCRGHSKRHYLPAELSINKILKMYNIQAEENLKVKKAYFRKVFNNNYALGFGTPRTDVCSTCLQISERLKTEKNLGERNNLMIAKRVHVLKAKAFYDLVKDEAPTMKTFCFDCQKNMPLPKVPDQSTYYSRQIYLYNLTVVEGSSKSKLTAENVFAYCWTEDELSKGSNEIASAIYNRLIKSNFTGISKVRLIADGCAGQNKNSIVITMCCKWLIDNAPKDVKTVELVFPVVGHSFIPPDRVFAQTEKEVKKKEVIAVPEDYINIIKERSTVIWLGTECPVYDWKKTMPNVIKDVGAWHFQFKKSKRIFVRRCKNSENIVIKGDMNYKVSEGVFNPIHKKNKTIKMIDPNVIQLYNTRVNDKKIADVKKLLITHYGDNWMEIENLKFYVDIFVRYECIPPALENVPAVEDGDLCELQDDDGINLRI